MESVCGVGECGRTVAAGLGDMCVGVEYDLRTSTRGPADRLRIPPPFVADNNAEGQLPGGEDSALGPECRRDGFARRVDLTFVLPPRDRTIGIYDTRRDLQAVVGHAFRAQYDRDVGRRSDSRRFVRDGVGKTDLSKVLALVRYTGYT